MRKIVCLLVGFLLVFQVNAMISKKISLSIIYIGNSITQGVLIDDPMQNAPPVCASNYLSMQKDIDLHGFSNQGVSGLTTVDFLPAQNTFFPKIVKAAALLVQDKKDVLLFSIMLGTNDSAIKGPNGSPVSPVQYFTNLKTIIDELLRIYPEAIFVLHRPIWYSPNTYNSSTYLKAGLGRLESYTPELDKLINTYAAAMPGHVFMGDTDAFDYFRINYETKLIPEDGNAGIFYLHPNNSGASRLGEFWGKAIYRIITKEID